MVNDKTSALVILSGGQDSTTCLFWTKQRYKDVHAITFDYGQRHSAELEAAKKVAEMAGVKSHCIQKIPAEMLKSTSPLTNADGELEQYRSHEQMAKVIGNRREATFVPMRNALFLTIAANHAISLHCGTLVTGVCQMDNANYDDCRLEFIASAEEYINYAIGADHRMNVQEIDIVTPLMRMTKKDTVLLAHSMPQCWEALAYTVTSYAGDYPPLDSNHATVLRAQGFLEAGLADPLIMRAYREGLMPLPNTPNYTNTSFATLTEPIDPPGRQEVYTHYDDEAFCRLLWSERQGNALLDAACKRIECLLEEQNRKKQLKVVDEIHAINDIEGE